MQPTRRIANLATHPHPRRAGPPPQNHRDYGEVHLIDKAGAQVPLDGGGTAPDPDIGIAGGGMRLIERGVDAAGDEVKRGASHQKRGRS